MSDDQSVAAPVTTTMLEPCIANIRMHDPKGKNSLSPAFVASLLQQINALADSEEVRVVILSGSPTVFCAGADLETLRQLCAGTIKPTDITLSRALLDLPVPVVSAMEGHATGGGLALGLCADIAVLAEESRYGCSFMNMGFTPGMGMTRLMEHFMSPAIASELLFTGSFKRGRELIGKTSLNHILPQREVFPKALQIAQAIAEKPVQSLRTLKRYLSLKRRQIFEETISIESMMHELSFDQTAILQTIEENYVR